MPKIERISVAPLAFPYDALYPVFSASTLMTHFEKILRAHLDALTILKASYRELAAMTVYELLTARSLPRRDADEIRWHAGAVYAHELYFSSLSVPLGGYSQPGPLLAEAISQSIGSFSELVYRLREAATTMRGVGFLHLVRDVRGRLAIRCLRDYDLPQLSCERPLFCIDLWEHAYFVDHGARPDLAVDAFLSVLNWSAAEEKYKRS